MSVPKSLGDSPYIVPESVESILEFERKALEEYKNRKPNCAGQELSRNRSCCLAGLTTLQIYAVKALIASFPAQDEQRAQTDQR